MNQIDELKEQQAQQVTDAFIIDYDYLDEETGEKIKDESFSHPEYGEQEVKTNVSKLFKAGLSTTTSISLLVAEAELMEEGRIGGNPHVPASMEVLEQAESRIEANDLTPAWTVFDESSTEASSSSDQPTAAD